MSEEKCWGWCQVGVGEECGEVKEGVGDLKKCERVWGGER